MSFIYPPNFFIFTRPKYAEVKVHRLSLDDYAEVNFELLAIYTGIEPFQVAFQINKALDLSLKRQDKDLDFNFFEASFPHFFYEDVKKHTQWSLIANKCLTEQPFMNSSGSLFSTHGFKEEVVKFLMPDKKEIDYFLKIKGIDTSYATEIIQVLKKQSVLSNVYQLNPHQLKSFSNLIT